MRSPETLDPDVERELAALDAALAGDRSDPALAELVAAVRAERPEPDPAFRESLDRRVADGFPRAARPRRPAWWPARTSLMPELGIAAATVVVLLVSVSVLVRSGDDVPVGGGAGAGGGAESSVGAMDERDASGGGSVAPPFTLPPHAEGDPSDARRERLVERSASLYLTAPPAEVPRVADRIIRVTDAMGGFVSRSSVRTDDVTGGGATFELRVRVGRLERTLAELSRLGHVVERSQDAQDVTAPYVSARSRLRAARAEREALLRQLSRAETVNATESIRVRLRVVERQIAAARADARRVAARAAFATIAVTLSADEGAGAGADDGRWTPGDAIRDAVRVLEVAAAVALVALAIALPVALLAVPAAALWRLGARRRRERALDAA